MMKSKQNTIKKSRKMLGRGTFTTIFALRYTLGTWRLCTHMLTVGSSKLNEEERKELTSMSQLIKMHVCLAAKKNYICVGIGRMNDQK